MACQPPLKPRVLTRLLSHLDLCGQQARRALPGLGLPVLLLAASPALQAAEDTPALGEQVRQLGTRLQQLEARNRALEERLRAQEAEEAAPEEGGLAVEGGVVAVWQRSNAAGSAEGRATGRLNYRGDLEFSLPMGRLSPLGEAQLSGFGHLRFGQGSGLALRPTHTATGNSVPFETAGGSEETYAIVAQAWLQASWPLAGSGLNDQAPSRVELTAGKLDLFGFFDQNAVAGDEGAQFLNNVFVHNPLLDSGGDIGADAYGLAPGVRLAWVDEGEDSGWRLGLSAGVFASGAGASFNGGLGRPLVIVQAEASPKQINGEPRGSYRLYAWTNGHTTNLAGDAEQRHSGWGLSLDQRVGRDWNLFARWGARTEGEGSFDRALTLGAEQTGRAWGRPHDSVGLALGWLRTDAAWTAATAADASLLGYAARGHERVGELYYRYQLNERIELSPDVQWIDRAGGQGDARRVVLTGLRASIGF
ncbi:carbohydrate porin [Ideonella livida]|uniref:Transporter n=1 Tax=Ideonella livida TaxID=2707176 RepID=A0A7C9PHR8_9BURK|nr:carbohydrate porin [Ideonella livida]NDY91572.1 transporter [Ideonella livida]